MSASLRTSGKDGKDEISHVVTLVTKYFHRISQCIVQQRDLRGSELDANLNDSWEQGGNSNLFRLDGYDRPELTRLLDEELISWDPRMDSHSITIDICLSSTTHGHKLLERWTLNFKHDDLFHHRFSSGNYDMVSSSMAGRDSRRYLTDVSSIYKRMTVQVRSVLSLLSILPCEQLVRDWGEVTSRIGGLDGYMDGEIEPFALYPEIYSRKTDSRSFDGNCLDHCFQMIRTAFGTFHVTCFYRQHVDFDFVQTAVADLTEHVRADFYDGTEWSDTGSRERKTSDKKPTRGGRHGSGRIIVDSDRGRRLPRYPGYDGRQSGDRVTPRNRSSPLQQSPLSIFPQSSPVIASSDGQSNTISPLNLNDRGRNVVPVHRKSRTSVSSQSPDRPNPQPPILGLLPPSGNSPLLTALSTSSGHVDPQQEVEEIRFRASQLMGNVPPILSLVDDSRVTLDDLRPVGNATPVDSVADKPSSRFGFGNLFEPLVSRLKRNSDDAKSPATEEKQSVLGILQPAQSGALDRIDEDLDFIREYSFYDPTTQLDAAVDLDKEMGQYIQCLMVAPDSEDILSRSRRGERRGALTSSGQLRTFSHICALIDQKNEQFSAFSRLILPMFESRSQLHRDEANHT